MSVNFKALLDAPAGIISRIAELDPSNPFYTNSYAEVQRRLGATPCAFFIENGDRIECACLGFFSHGRINARLEITSLPVISDEPVFWNGLLRASRRFGVSVLSVNTFSSTQPSIDATEGRTSHKRRSEYRLDLTAPDLSKLLHRRHKRAVRAARSAGLEFVRASDRASRLDHIALCNATLDRLRGRGESIDAEIGEEMIDALIDCGAGEIFQVIRDGVLFGSLLAVRSRTGAYAQSSGTSDEGRGLGASHLIFHDTACVLQSEGVEVFNLGGADEHSAGLQEFKLGFGSVRIDLEAAEFYTGGILKKFATRAASLLRG